MKKKPHFVGLSPFQIGRALLDDNLSLCTTDEVNLLSGYLRSRDIVKLASYTSENRLLSPSHCLFFDQMNALFKKNAEFASKDLNSTAWSTFQKNERHCRITSRRLDYFLFTRPERCDEEVFNILVRASNLVERWLGSYRTFLGKIPEYVRTTGGATSTTPKAGTSSVEKIKLRQDVPVDCVPLLSAYAAYINKPLRITVNNFNRIAFVPKNYKTARTIACEPQGMLPLQLACDSLVKQRLRSVGVNLSDQTRNQSLAKYASEMGDTVTLDLANASDSLTIPVLEFLLPKPFFELFMRLRSPFYKCKYGSGVYSKYASMGNGLTFPLETLVFSAIVAACGGELKGDSSIYGDDIICPTRISQKVIKTLEFIGFKLNHDKSFSSGPFRESCGENYYRGVRVTPYFLRDKITQASDLCLTINSLVEIFPQSESLTKLFLKSAVQNQLPLGPVSLDLRDSLHVAVTTAYKHKCIRLRDGMLYVRRFKETPNLKTRKVIIRAHGSVGYYYWLITRNGRNRAADDFYVGYHEEFSVPREKFDDINVRCRLRSSLWHIALGNFNRDHSLLNERIAAMQSF